MYCVRVLILFSESIGIFISVLFFILEVSGVYVGVGVLEVFFVVRGLSFFDIGWFLSVGFLFLEYRFGEGVVLFSVLLFV